ncbi:hypothetical protein CHS0354_034609 [Potamilus streckersoni]|uniref:Transglutaminase-like domain-containing protein n=1 Tax=Potamilus streckersoni TaxID=2493646 RepID=A0AAE0SSL8_9BIVA|nr:hypothetical protein CHS0354_034609 [Potamilus streckersoni]
MKMGNAKRETKVSASTRKTEKREVTPKPDILSYADDCASKSDTNKEEDVPPLPPKTKKEDIVPNTAIFKGIDEHALKAPTSALQSASELAKYLVKQARNDLERIRAFYRWITENIRYDTDGYFSGMPSSCKPEDVLRSGKSVCQGYADLFTTLCREVGISAKTISGYAKGYSYHPEQSVTPSADADHAWNVVLLNGDWRFVECTWGAGHVNGHTFVKEFTEFYFLTDPDHFINAHFPWMEMNEEEDAKWQLLWKPISLTEYSRRLKLSKDALKLGITPVSHTSGVLEIKSEETITIKDNKRNIENWMVNFYIENGIEMGNYVMSYMQDKTTLIINVRPPTQAKYILKIYGKSRSKQTELYDNLIEYIVKSNNEAKNVKPYPCRSKPWASCPEYEMYGFTEKVMVTHVYMAKRGEVKVSIPTTRLIDIMAKIRHAEDAVGNLENYCLVEALPQYIVVEARFPKEGFYELEILVKKESDGHYWPAISYLVDCSTAMDPCYKFPVRYNLKYQCHLLEPLRNPLPPQTNINFRLESPMVQKFYISGKYFDKTKENLFEGTIVTPDRGDLNVFGSENGNGSMLVLFTFSVSS